jgi:hypothetical protein
VEVFILKCEAFVKITRILKDILREKKAILNKYEDFIKITRLFKSISREIKASV